MILGSQIIELDTSINGMGFCKTIIPKDKILEELYKLYTLKNDKVEYIGEDAAPYIIIRNITIMSASSDSININLVPTILSPRPSYNKKDIRYEVGYGMFTDKYTLSFDNGHSITGIEFSDPAITFSLDKKELRFKIMVKCGIPCMVNTIGIELTR